MAMSLYRPGEPNTLKESGPDGGQEMSLAGNPTPPIHQPGDYFQPPPTECQSLAEQKLSPSSSFYDFPSSFHQNT
ncbi:Accessory colonization factor AcfD [Dissostichus eleginoides]|uniref:Accessory colonization factor AcfD n=1 Tax=Dissostichus eleginoides TaxID=100907 RepID=A0AAD9BW15_DISEL|nr:Accessory colonization factor AcfD [Dissostichus eleginoides]